MAEKKRASKKEKKGLAVLIIGIIIVALILAFYSYSPHSIGVKISCKDGKILGFGKISMPLMCAGCIPNCKANVEVRDVNNNVICLNSYSGDDVVIVPCPKLKDHKGEEVLIKYSVNSSYNNSSGEEKLIYGK